MLVTEKILRPNERLQQFVKLILKYAFNMVL